MLNFFYFGKMNDHARITTFESYYDPMLAQIIYTKLRANRIQCFIADENILWAKPYFNQMLGGVKIRVFEKDIEKCKNILAAKAEAAVQDDTGINDELATDITCMYCGSNQVRRGIATIFKFHLPSLLVSVFLGAPFYFCNCWHCFHCHREFE
jgi:hypothetical protein